MQANLNICPTIDQLLSTENRINDSEPA